MLVLVRTYPIRASLSQALLERISMGKRENSEAGIAGTRKTRNVACRIEAIPGKCDGLIIICQEEPDRDFTVLPGEIVNICGELVFAEMAWFREH